MSSWSKTSRKHRWWRRSGGVIVIQLILVCSVCCALVLASGSSLTLDLNDEARAEAKKLIDARLIQHVNGDWFSIIPGGSFGSPDHYFHVKGFSYSINEEALTSIDRLNGVEWKGFLVLQADALRDLYYRNGTNDKWNEWSAYRTVNLPFRKKRGTWRFSTSVWNLGSGVPTAAKIELVLQLPMHDY